MNRSVKHIFTKAIIFSMMFFLCLPCSVKQEIKQVLNIPAANPGNTVKSSNPVICLSFNKEAGNKISGSHQKKDLPAPSGLWGFRRSNVVHAATRVPFSADETAIPVPIYILHEQYLI